MSNFQLNVGGNVGLLWLRHFRIPNHQYSKLKPMMTWSVAFCYALGGSPVCFEFFYFTTLRRNAINCYDNNHLF